MSTTLRQVGADTEVEKLRRKVELGNKMKHVPALHLATALALQGMTKEELEALGGCRPRHTLTFDGQLFNTIVTVGSCKARVHYPEQAIGLRTAGELA